MSHFTSTTEPLPDHPFWQFSCWVYQEHSLKFACLKLQDQLNMNVNFILFACWLATNGRGRLQVADFSRLDQLTATWRQFITLKLRSFRQSLARQVTAHNRSNLINVVQQEELAAEQIEQLMLAHNFASILPRERTGLQKASDAANSLQNYAHHLDVNLRAEECRWLADILQAIFPRISTTDIEQLCGVTN